MALCDLKLVRIKDEAKKRGRNGGIASGKARTAKRLAAKTYAEADFQNAMVWNRNGVEVYFKHFILSL